MVLWTDNLFSDTIRQRNLELYLLSISVILCFILINKRHPFFTIVAKIVYETFSSTEKVI
jgi:hypothetical protein